MANLSRFGGVPRSSIFLSEQAGAQADSAGSGQFWVKSDTPNIPMFTNDAGTDFQLGIRSAGTFTPTLQDDSLSNAEGQTYTAQTGQYRVFNDVVFLWINLIVNSLGTLNTSQVARIAGLPFTVAQFGTFTPYWGASLNIGGALYVIGEIAAGGTVINLLKWSSATGPTVMTIGELSAGGQILGNGWYRK